MKIKKYVITCFLLGITMIVSACGGSEKENNSAEEYKNIYKTVVRYTGEEDSTSEYLEIAERSAELIPLLEENVNAFVMDAYNYQTIDDEGTPLYEMNDLDYPVEIDPAGHCIRVSKNYFQFNPIDTADGNDVVEQIIYDDLTLNVLVPEKYMDMEEQIIATYREQFYSDEENTEDVYQSIKPYALIFKILSCSLANLKTVRVKARAKARGMTYWVNSIKSIKSM